MWDGTIDDAMAEVLLGRKVIAPMSTPSDGLQGRRVLVTGAAGSIGSALFHSISRSSPALLVGIDINELNTVNLLHSFDAASDVNRKLHIVDIRNRALVEKLFATYDFDLVFNAAALKHVPFLEDDFNLIEAIRTNISGTDTIADACVAHQAELVHISTDKAVNPASNMGFTKRIAEILLENKAGQNAKARFKVIRFCNVLGSSGSVVPRFIAQARKGGPVTLTHPDMTRFMITISEAIHFTLSILSVRSAGYACYIPDVRGEMRIADLAERIIALCASRNGTPAKIDVIGIRPGETLFELLRHDFEAFEPTQLEGVLEMTSDHCDQGQIDAIRQLIRDADKGAADTLSPLMKTILACATYADRAVPQLQVRIA